MKNKLPSQDLKSQLKLEKIGKPSQKNIISMSQSPQRRYLKRVLNKEIDVLVTSIKQQKSAEQQQQSKQFFRSQSPYAYNPAVVFREDNPIQQQQYQESVNNFSLGLFTKLQATDYSFVKEANEQQRKQIQKKLNFNKVFLMSQQNTPYKQVIQLSIRQLENKQMLQKAMHQLQKRILQKKYKMRKKQMNLNLSSPRMQDPSIQQLRSHRIGYKTFYKRQIMTARSCQQKKRFLSSQAKIKMNKNEFKKQLQVHAKYCEKIEMQNNVFVSDEQDISNRKRNKTDIGFAIDDRIVSHHEPRSNNRQTMMCKNRENNQKTSCQLDMVKDNQKQDIRRPKKYSKKKFHVSLQSDRLQSQSQPTFYKPLESMRQFPKIERSPKVLRQMTEPQLKSQEQVELQNKMKSVNDQFPFLLTSEDLENTLNKSRYQVKKLLCMHIQKRKKQWKKMKNKVLYDEQIPSPMFNHSYKEIKTARNQNYKLKTIYEAQNETEGILQLSQLRQSKSLMLPPAHVIKMNTKQLKTSIKTFVKRMKTSRSHISQLKVPDCQ